MSIRVSVDGYKMDGLCAPPSVNANGRKFSLTKGLDGSSINISTPQGGTVVIKLRNDSSSLTFLDGLFKRQQEGRGGATITFKNGAELLVEFRDSYIERPQPLSNCIKYTFTYTELQEFDPLWRQSL